MSARGRFIVIEGLDGTGKSTLAAGLAERLGAVALRTPGAALAVARPVIDHAYRHAPIAAQLFYASSVVAAAAEAMAILSAGRDVVCDRYWLSTWVYARERAASVDLRVVEATLPPADLTVLCEVDEETRCERLQRRGMSAADQATLDPGRAGRLRRRYRKGLLRPVAGRSVVLDLTGKSPAEAVDAALRSLAAARPRRGPAGPALSRAADDTARAPAPQAIPCRRRAAPLPPGPRPGGAPAPAGRQKWARPGTAAAPRRSAAAARRA